MKLQDAPEDKLIAAFVKIRDQRAQRKAAFDSEDSGDKEKQERIEAEFLRRFHERGATSTKSDAGTAYLKVTTQTSVADRDVYFGWILDDPKERMVFLEARANKNAVLQYRGENDDLPPGINFAETQTVGFRRS